MLSRWENGKPVDEERYQRLLCKVYDRTLDELGFVSRRDTRLGSSRRVVPNISPDTVGYFRNIFTEHIRADNLLGPHHLVEVVRAQATLLDGGGVPVAQREHSGLQLTGRRSANWVISRCDTTNSLDGSIKTRAIPIKRWRSRIEPWTTRSRPTTFAVLLTC